MYHVLISNNGIENTINFPSSDVNDPHLVELQLTEFLSAVDKLSFNIYKNNPSYDKITELITLVKAKDIRDEEIRFTGRIFDQSEEMISDGKIYKKIVCEGALGFLNDTRQRSNTFTTTDVKTFLAQILSIHNGKVEPYKQIQVGNVDVIGSVVHTCEFKTTLAELLSVKEKVGGHIRVRETNNVLYLDWLQSFSNDIKAVRLGENMKDMIKRKDTNSLGTRIIPLGANNLTISSVNGGLDYIEDTNAKNIYGVIEKTIEYRDIENATELKNKCLSDLNKYTQPLYILECNALDLSFLTGIKSEQFKLGSSLHIINAIMGIDSIYEIVGLDVNLLRPYNPKITISNTPLTLTSYINDLKQSSVQNNGVYNNVQVGDAFGIRAVRSDGKVTTTLNATDGISIENESKKVFYVDNNGNIIANDGTFNNMVANEMRTSNTSSYMILHDQYAEFYKDGRKIMQLGFDTLRGLPAIELFTEDGAINGLSIAGGGQLLTIGSFGVEGTCSLYGDAYYKGSEIATKADLAALSTS